MIVTPKHQSAFPPSMAKGKTTFNLINLSEDKQGATIIQQQKIKPLSSNEHQTTFQFTESPEKNERNSSSPSKSDESSRQSILELLSNDKP